MAPLLDDFFDFLYGLTIPLPAHTHNLFFAQFPGKVDSNSFVCCDFNTLDVEFDAY
jgi:hypothetical protein